MSEPVGGLHIRLSAETAKLIKDLGKARGAISKFNRQAGKEVQGLSSQFATLAKGIGLALVGRQIARAITNTAKLGDELAKMSARTGFSVETLNGLTQAAGLADVSQEQLSVALRQLSKNLLDTTRGTGEAKDSFEAMGIGGKEAAALLKTPDEAFLQIADRLAAIPDTSTRAAEAMRIFGRSGAELLPLLNQGRAAIEAQIKTQQKLRPITTEQAKAAEQYNDALTSLQFAFEGLLHRGIGPLLPGMKDLVNIMTSLVSLNTNEAADRMAHWTSVIGTGFRGIAGVVVTVNTELQKALRIMEAFGQIASPLDFFGGERGKAISRAVEADIAAMSRNRDELLGRIFPEATGGKPKDFTVKPSASPQTQTTLPETLVAERTLSAEMASKIKLKEAELRLLEVQEKRLAIEQDREEIVTAAMRHKQAEIALLEEAMTIQKEVEAAAKDKRAVDPVVAQTARLKTRTTLVELALTEEAVTRAQSEALEEQRKLQQEILGTDQQHAAAVDLQFKMQDLTKIALQSQHDLELARLDPMMDAAQLRGQEILTLRDQLNLLEAQKEVLGETAELNREIELIKARINALTKEGAALLQEALGRAIVANATADLQARLEPFRRAVDQIQKEIDIGAAMPNTLPETQQLRQIELIQANTALLTEQWRTGLIASTEYHHQTGVLDAELFAATTQTQRGFIEGWSDAFKQFTEDSKGAFGLGQTLARNFVSNIQSGLASTIGNIFDHATEKTLTWRTALETIPDILKQITAQLTSMMVVQGVAQALAGGLGGAAGNSLGGPTATGAGFFNPIGAASGADFMIGGRGGIDANFLPMRVSRGERVMIETPQQQRQSKGGNVTVNVNNFEGADVSTTERDGPDGRVLDVLIERKIQQSNRSGSGRRSTAAAFGLPIRGRVG